jgi:hypothetical protein
MRYASVTIDELVEANRAPVRAPALIATGDCRGFCHRRLSPSTRFANGINIDFPD